eukprot:756372-Hanusia_phi.AAC.6
MEQDAAAAHLEVMLRSVGGISKSGMDVGMSTVGLSKMGIYMAPSCLKLTALRTELSTESNPQRMIKEDIHSDAG